MPQRLPTASTALETVMPVKKLNIGKGIWNRGAKEDGESSPSIE